MRALLCLALSVGLVAGEPALPGRDARFLRQVLTEGADPTQPWRTLRVPEEGASAVVEVVGVLTPEDLRQAAFQEFLVWFRADLRRFLRHDLDSQGRNWDLAAAALPVLRHNGNPLPKPAALGWGY